MLVTFSPSPCNRNAAVPQGGLDLIAAFKVGARALALLVLAVLIAQLWNHPKRRRVIRFLLPLGGFVAWAVLSTLWSPLKAVSVGQSGSLVVLWMMAATLGILCSRQSDSSVVLRQLCVGLALVAGLMLLLRLGFPGSYALTRSGGGVLHSTNSGATASLGLVLLIACRLLWGWSWTRKLLLPGLILFPAVLVLANNRASMTLTLGITMGLFALFSSRFLFAVVAVIVGVVGIGYLTLDPGLETVGGGIDSALAYAQRDQSAHELADLSGRKFMWREIWRSYLESPWIGHGYFVSSKTGELYVWYKSINWTAHNMVLQTLVSTGLIGALWLMWGILYPAAGTLAGYARGRIDGRMLFFLAVLGAWYLGWGLLNASIAGPLQPESVVFYTVLGMTIGRIVVGPGRETSRSY